MSCTSTVASMCAMTSSIMDADLEIWLTTPENSFSALLHASMKLQPHTRKSTHSDRQSETWYKGARHDWGVEMVACLTESACLPRDALAVPVERCEACP